MRQLLPVIVVLAGTIAAARADEPAALPQPVRAILAGRCLDCHTGDAAEAGVRLAQALVVKSSTDPDKAKKIESLQRAVDLLKRSQDLKKRDSVGKYLADLEKALQKTKGM
jgi:hypothetical protein